MFIKPPLLYIKIASEVPLVLKGRNNDAFLHKNLTGAIKFAGSRSTKELNLHIFPTITKSFLNSLYNKLQSYVVYLT